ncbi:MAG: segregation/condensation protein A [Myxococcota bacterium]
METHADEVYRVELPAFEGPLDLLLYLVRRHELEILDIPIAFITERYLEHLALMRQLSLEVAAEYLLMAATLAHLKSRELLPSPEVTTVEDEEDDGPDSRAELIRRLLEYQRYKDAAEKLAERPVLGRDVFTRRGPAPEMQADTSEAPLAEISVFSLLESLGEIMKKARVELGQEIVVDRVSVVQRIHDLVDRLERERSFTLESCIDLAAGVAQVRHQVIVTFLALLEMTRLRLTRIHQTSVGEPIYISRASEDLRTTNVVADWR